MDLIQIIVLALVQGFTEFLPISSSAHLILVPALTGWQDQGLAFDVAVHVGTLLAVVSYFRQEIVSMFFAWIDSLKTRSLTPDGRLAWAVLLGTIPAGLAGLLLKDYIETELRSPLVIATATIGFGLLLWWADVKGKRQRGEYQVTWRDVLVIGISQALALIPGTSRSGATMTAGLFMGLTREASARFSFLLSIPLIFLAGGFQTLELIGAASPVDWTSLLLGVVLSAVSAYVCIHLFLKLLEQMGMLPFVIYRMLLGIGLFVLFL
jgi:undecaprenyl-diphosphatase